MSPRRESMRALAVSPRPLRLYATLWSLRQYPTRSGEWSWAKKFSVIREAGFDGIFSPPIAALQERGDLDYLAVTSLDHPKQVEPSLRAAQALRAVAIDVQLGDYDSKLADMVKLAMRVRDIARELALPFAIETHRNTFTETPEATVALARGYRTVTKETLPLCLDHSHFAVVRHLARDAFWANLKEPAELLAAATQFHLRPFNGHHCQIPVLDARGRRTPEYRDWLAYSAALFAYLKTQPATAPVLAVPELGNAAPAYGLSCFGDTWRDTQAVARDLRRQWRAPL
ncbi:MAG: hypothetical protein ABI222_07390 [Opitutaceae bacterium]